MKSATNSNANPTLNNSHTPSPTTSSTSQPLLYANNLSKSVKVGEQRIDIIKGIDVAVQAGEFAVIMGKSGSGKSTLLGLLAGLDYPDSGEVWLDGQNLTKLNEEALAQKRQQDMGFVFQSFHLLPTLTVAENIAFPLDIARRPDPSRVEELLTAVGLMHRRDSLPHQLSGGEQQRTALARALVARPKIIFADEPTGNLDEQNAQQVMHLLLELQQQSGTALVVVTHDPSLSTHANQVITIVDGRVEN
ncbi:ABC transporter ATP-binding protein [Psychrobacter sp. I-STPA6b]|uniref:ABC transporter ATP-binding protein n=1 Tax=Psychrobacter sp. I-STPA6b TaxID=2585718 RepID=UPI001D0C49DB|nr:ABC transporter ATP-binding protein [Psychrobacter sp. I-STPA6b]